MTLDYYEILGVSPDAGMREVKNAYRRRAVECHPDLGGSHEKMLLINEAWEVLSDSYTRMHYDNARRNLYDYEAQRVAEEEKEQARNRAQTYPRNWSDFATWLDCFVCDFTEAEYIYPADKPNGGFYPAVQNSISGKLFCISGAVASSLVATFVFTSLEPILGKSRFAMDIISLGSLLSYIILPPIGAISACALHKKIGRLLKS